MLPELLEIKTRRKQLGLTQSELAQKTGISQSLLAKIESEQLVPAYSKAKRIFDFFESIQQKTRLLAGDIMNPRVKSVKSTVVVADAIRLMKKNGISQLPVLENGSIVGVVSENAIVEGMQVAKKLSEFKELPVFEIMLESLPTVTRETPFKAVSALLDHNSAVLVLKKGAILGIISRSDLLGAVLKKEI